MALDFCHRLSLWRWWQHRILLKISWRLHLLLASSDLHYNYPHLSRTKSSPQDGRENCGDWGYPVGKWLSKTILTAVDRYCKRWCTKLSLSNHYYSLLCFLRRFHNVLMPSWASVLRCLTVLRDWTSWVAIQQITLCIVTHTVLFEERLQFLVAQMGVFLLSQHPKALFVYLWTKLVVSKATEEHASLSQSGTTHSH